MEQGQPARHRPRTTTTGAPRPLTPNVEFRWSDQAAQRWLELQSGTVDGIDNPGTDDIADHQGRLDLTFYPREGLNTFYLGLNNTIKPWSNEKVRQAIAMGIDRQRIVDNFYPEGSEVATHFTPCAIPFGCEGDATWDFDPDEAKALLAEGWPRRASPLETKLQFRDAVRGYLPDPPQIATEIASQLKTNLGINAAIDLQESGAFLDANAAGTLDGLFLLGWGADYPDATNFLDYHFGSGSGTKFGAAVRRHRRGPQQGRPDGRRRRSRRRPTRRPTTSSSSTCPAVIIAHGGSGTAFKADVDGRPQLAAQQRGLLGHEGRRPRHARVDAERRAAQPLLRRRDGRRDAARLRADQGVPVRLRGRRHGHRARRCAESCTPNDDLTIWTCTLREGVTFHDGATLDANDVVVSYAAQWDTQHPLHIGRTGAFEYFPGLLAAASSTRRPRPS